MMLPGCLVRLRCSDTVRTIVSRTGEQRELPFDVLVVDIVGESSGSVAHGTIIAWCYEVLHGT